MSILSPSSIRVTNRLEEKISACQSQAEVQEVLRTEALNQHVVKADWDESILNPTPGAARLLGTVVEINDTSHEIVSDSEADLLRQQNALYAAALGQPAAATAGQPARDAETGRFVAEITPEERAAADAAAAAEAQRLALLDLNYRNGIITTEQYIEQSGLIERHLQKKTDEAAFSGWKNATDEFLASPEGANWPGRSALGRMTEILQANHLEDAPSVDALKQAWALMQSEAAEEAIAKTVTEINDPYALRNALQGGRDGSMFGR